MVRDCLEEQCWPQTPGKQQQKVHNIKVNIYSKKQHAIGLFLNVENTQKLVFM
jgi:hypothetical protein